MSPGAIQFVSDFNIETLARQVANTAFPGIETNTAPIGQVMQVLAAGPPGPHWSAVVWTQPQAVSASFGAALAGEEPQIEKALEETVAYGEAIGRYARGARAVLVPAWVLPPWQRGYGPLDFRPRVGIAHALAKMNVALSDALGDEPNVFVLDTSRWMASVGPRAWSDKLWYAAKSPFSLAAYEHAALEIAAALAGFEGNARRIVILDLDNVLWGGELGELGWDGLNLGGHDHVGEAFAEFQRALKTLTRRGIQLAIVSKNDETVALEALERHPEMQLRKSDFAGWRINWRDKAQNVADLLDDLGLAPDSAVFIDDSALERARVAGAIPGILVPEWPSEPARYRAALGSLRCFDATVLTREDRERTAMYAGERSRRTSLAGASSTGSPGNFVEWLRSLGVTVTAAPLGWGNLERAAQLLNKTNQMNLATRRLSSAELMAWAEAPGHTVLAFRVADRFGDSGLTGLIGLALEGTTAHLVDFLLSCRVMGRQVEETMLHVAVTQAGAHGAVELIAPFRATPRNGPCREFFQRSGLEVRPGSVPNSRSLELDAAPGSSAVFVWDARKPYPLPPGVTLRDDALAVGARNL